MHPAQPCAPPPPPTKKSDGYLRMWNLVKGRCTYTSRLPAPADALAFAPGGGRYALLSGSCVALHAADGGGEQGPLAVLEHPRRVLCMAFCPTQASDGGHRLVTGCEDGSLRLWEAGGARGAAELACAPRAHATRIRALAVLPQTPAGAGADTPARLRVATASSDGAVKVWEFGGGAGAPRCLAQAETRARLTCLVALDGPAAMAARLKAEGRAKHAAAAAAEAVGTAAAAAAAAACPQGQQQQAGKKRPQQADGMATAAAQHQKRAGKEQQQKGSGKEQQQKGSGKAGGRAGKGSKEDDRDEGAGERVVLRDGVVEFPDDGWQAQREADKARLRAKKKRRREVQQQQQQRRRGGSSGGDARKKGRVKGAAFRPSAKPGQQMPGAERG